MITNKRYIGPNELLAKSFKLALDIFKDGFLPDYIVGIWRGGAPIGIAVQECFDYLAHRADHIAVRTSSYSRIGERNTHVLVHGLSYLSKRLNSDDRLLIIDDVFETGLSIEAVLNELTNRCRRNLPEQIRIATIFNKPHCHKVAKGPDYYLEETKDWLVFPHEISGLSPEEIRINKPELWAILESELPERTSASI